MTSHPDLAWLLLGGFLTAVVGVLATLATKALARAGSRTVAALVEIARLPDAVTDLIRELQGLARVVIDLGGRVKKLEELAGHAHVKADVSFTHTPPTESE